MFGEMIQFDDPIIFKWVGPFNHQLAVLLLWGGMACCWLRLKPMTMVKCFGYVVGLDSLNQGQGDMVFFFFLGGGHGLLNR